MKLSQHTSMTKERERLSRLDLHGGARLVVRGCNRGPRYWLSGAGGTLSPPQAAPISGLTHPGCRRRTLASVTSVARRATKVTARPDPRIRRTARPGQG